ncbi:hypothetical protein ABPG72_000558 [Tetrahymena utriculariae]
MHKFIQYSIKPLFLILISLSSSQQQVKQFVKCQQEQKQIITKYYSEYVKNADSLISSLLQKIFIELQQLQSKCLGDSCWVDGKEQYEKFTLQPCIKNNDFWMAACKPGYKPLGKTSSSHLIFALIYILNNFFFNYQNLVCTQKCPHGFIEDKEQCIKPNSYSRGVGYSWIPQDGPFSVVKSQLRYNKENPNTSCEQCGSFSFPKCKKNFKASSCFVCKPVCPDGTEDTIKTCKQNNYQASDQFFSGTCFEQKWERNQALIEKEQFSNLEQQLLDEVRI